MFCNGNVSDHARIKFDDGEHFEKYWPNNARLTLNDAIEKLMKEKAKREAQKKKNKAKENSHPITLSSVEENSNA